MSQQLGFSIGQFKIERFNTPFNIDHDISGGGMLENISQQNF